MKRLADIYCICTHLNRQRNLAEHVACVHADYTAAQSLSVETAFMTIFDFALEVSLTQLLRTAHLELATQPPCCRPITN